MNTESFSISQNLELSINTSCDVSINYHNGDSVVIQSTTEDVKVSQTGNKISIRQDTSSGGVFFGGDKIFGNVFLGDSRQGSTFRQVNINGGSVVSSGSGGIHISGSGPVYINGKRVDVGEDKGDHVTPNVKILVPATVKTDLDAKMSGGCSLFSNIEINDSFINLSGHVVASIKANNLEIHCVGSSEVEAVVGNGDLDVNISGSAQISATGTFGSVRVSLSGSGNVVTDGKCLGNYSISASGSGSVRHFGKVNGRVRESVNGTAKVFVN